jgi:hypothetical protein
MDSMAEELTTRILIEIRDEIRSTNKRLVARIEAVLEIEGA